MELTDMVSLYHINLEKKCHLTLTKNENKEIAMEFYKYMYWKCKTVHKESLEQIQYQQHQQDVWK